MTDATVLIQGESGTGKELIARAIHFASKRKNQPLIKVNCAALPAGLVESELFGHEKGAFTGALNKRIGRFELAQGGTLFLDEVGEIPLDIQVKLLRVLQEREFERVGSQTTIKMDVRVIAATNRDLLQEVAEKNFREDLFYRLNVFPLFTPPLRERLEDIPMLTNFLIGKFGPNIGKKITGVSNNSMLRLQKYRWPGNIRELENLIERAIILSDGPILEIDDQLLPNVIAGEEKTTQVGDASLNTVAKEHILNILQQTHWIVEGPKGAASMLNLKPSTLRYRMQKLGINKPD
jgi:transcriptional regulator with GAF, ATPase, and Fis domain